jgi:hypothetical protein
MCLEAKSYDYLASSDVKIQQEAFLEVSNVTSAS